MVAKAGERDPTSGSSCSPTASRCARCSRPDLPDDLAATRRTLSGALEYFQTVARDWEMIHFTVERFVDGGDDVVMVGRCAWRNRATARVVDTPKVDVWRFEGGKAVQLPRNVRQPRLSFAPSRSAR